MNRPSRRSTGPNGIFTLGLAASLLPLQVPSYEVSLLWNAPNAQDPGMAWLASEFATAFGKTERRSEPGLPRPAYAKITA
ncbi:hypothetical protein [Pandoraea sp.]|uniref:hypothetical protein n=1 Tax=Pandoraea sp. TaxID=1883445 RepID=UPI001207459E|nr:hypothetical protein [Pandoraea sp.]TAL52443.1 MAG: hypothetical protein EPN80_19920 [Pandoraea sp.]TAM16253.1 MAG: hypothetical protein EPN65_16165 [Pandoraea sp.]